MKKLLAAFLSLAMLALAGCGSGEATADGLMSSLDAVDPEGYADMSVYLTADAGDIDLSVEADVESAGGVVHVADGFMRLEAGGTDARYAFDAWLDLDAGTSYVKAGPSGADASWTMSGPGDEVPEGLASMGVPGIVDRLREGADIELAGMGADGDYVVRWTVPDAVLDGILAGFDGAGDIEISSMGCSFRFERETERPAGMAWALDSTLDGEPASMDAAVTFRVLGGDAALAIPEDVVAEAADAGAGPDGPSGTVPGFDITKLPDGVEYPVDSADPPTGNLTVDGSGSDGVLDGLADYLSDHDPSGLVYLHHYGRYATLSWYPGTSGEWSGGLTLTHYDEDASTDAEEQFGSGVDFLSEYYDMGPSYGGKDGHEAGFTYRDGEDLDLHLSWIAYGDGVLAEADVFCREHDSDADARGHLDGMLDTVRGYGA